MAGSIYTVAQINSYIKNMFTQDYLLGAVSVKGEVSNCRYHASGHIYFTLKDKQSAISCVMFAGSRKGLSFSLKEGMQVVVSGRVDTYERDGKYQLYANRIVEDGIGDLYQRFRLLKSQLEEEGLFAEEYKRPLPAKVRILGVVTAETGAAIRDIISVAKNRDPYIQIVLYPAKVQGEGAAETIAAGIEALAEYGVDVIIAGRGGGSIEDLWAFNEEIVARAIFNSPIPVISAVGHETDVTIADYVADVRAETPSAAAALATMDVRSLIRELDSDVVRLGNLMQSKIYMCRLRVESYYKSLTVNSPRHRLNNTKTELLYMEDKLGIVMRRALEEYSGRLGILAARLSGLSPLDKLSQGYSYTECKGVNISSVHKLKSGDEISIYVKDGRIDAVVTDTSEVERQIRTAAGS